MGIERRTFLKGLGVLAAAPWLMRLEELAPWPQPRYVLHGDGVHDDAPALQELLDATAEGRAHNVEILADSVKIEGGALYLRRGVYAVGAALVFPESTFVSGEPRVEITDCCFTTEKPVSHIITVPTASGWTIGA